MQAWANFAPDVAVFNLGFDFVDISLMISDVVSENDREHDLGLIPTQTRWAFLDPDEVPSGWWWYIDLPDAPEGSSKYLDGMQHWFLTTQRSFLFMGNPHRGNL